MLSGEKDLNSGKGAFHRASSCFAFLLVLLFVFTFTSTCFSQSQTELGAEDDLTVLGTDGAVPDPDVEIKGFSVFGSTNVLTHISTAPGNVVINGALEVSSDVYVVGKSTFAGNVYIVGFSSANKFYGDGSSLTGISGDSLGSHIATATLNMSAFNITGVSTMTVSSITTTAAGVVFSTHVFIMNGNLGVGTTAPAQGRLEISAPTTAVNRGFGTPVQLFVHANNTSQQAEAGGRIDLGGYQTGLGYYTAGGIKGAYEADSGNKGYLDLFTQDVGSSLLTRMRIDGTGNVGISTKAPQARLDVLAAGSAQTDMAQIWRDGTGVIVGSMSATGVLKAVKFLGDGSALSGLGGTLSGGAAPLLPYWVDAVTLGNSSLRRDSDNSLTAVASTFTVEGNAFS
ncbi:MAG: hypothetical protein HY550_00230, partial [Elusimicrobia bacterium]|nr:hypothetical protein [Elusimicrobiota bacterium]